MNRGSIKKINLTKHDVSNSTHELKHINFQAQGIQLNINSNSKSISIDEKTKTNKRSKHENLGMITNPSLHRTTGIIMLDPESHIGNQSSIILGDRAFNLRIRHNKQPINPFQHTPHEKTEQKDHFFHQDSEKEKPCK